MSKSTAAYLAGFIDGEGTITITRSWSKKSKCDFYRVYLTVANTNKEIIDWLYKSYGGWIRTNYQEHERWKTIYRWHIYRQNDLESFLKSILPYLRLKKRQAEIVLIFMKLFDKSYSTFTRNAKGQIQNHSINKDIVQKRKELYSEIKQLNVRGRDAR